MHPGPPLVCWWRTLRRGESAVPRLCVRVPLHSRGCQVPRAPLPAEGVTLRGTMSCIVSRSITPSSSLLWAHAPNHRPPTAFGLGFGRWVCAGCRQSLPGHGPSRRYPCESFRRCLGPCRGGPLGAPARYFPNDVGLPPWPRGRRPASNPLSDFRAEALSRLQPFANVQASTLAATQVAPTAAAILTAGQPWRLHPSRTRVVAFACIGRACRPNEQLTAGDFHPIRLAVLSATPSG